MSLKISARVFVPQMVMSSESLRAQIVTKMQTKSAPEVRRLFQQTVQGWANQPVFEQKFSNSTVRITASIWPAANTKGGKIYNYVNNGTPSHTIPPRRKGGLLRFQRFYRAGTRPRVLSSRMGVRYGPMVSTPLVKKHPGLEAREFDAAIVEQYQDTFADDIQEVVHTAVERSWVKGLRVDFRL